ncbi:hypothetical protein GCM10008938_51880 [Deinococcus roseus]|uniref:Uncharacterized protein n=1 Tax=Deinococcus roseus TaxID=392414 RepID=A0ABQ2DL66_9DEIO|nr:hypothetical protein GCM10008938_51880 [Deinococcus roseus]
MWKLVQNPTGAQVDRYIDDFHDRGTPAFIWKYQVKGHEIHLAKMKSRPELFSISVYETAFPIYSIARKYRRVFTLLPQLETKHVETWYLLQDGPFEGLYAQESLYEDSAYLTLTSGEYEILNGDHREADFDDEYMLQGWPLRAYLQSPNRFCGLQNIICGSR